MHSKNKLLVHDIVKIHSIRSPLAKLQNCVDKNGYYCLCYYCFYLSIIITEFLFEDIIQNTFNLRFLVILHPLAYVYCILYLFLYVFVKYNMG